MNVSVIIPVYNAEAFLEKAVSSAIQQPQVKEILLIEDASPDQSLSCCHRLAEKYAVVKVYQHAGAENKGAAASRNLGLQYATQDYVSFLDADDFYLVNRFEQDEIIFNSNQEAEAVYNATGVFFYSEEAKNKFCFTMNIPIAGAEQHLTTLTQPVHPNELFDYLYKINKPFVGYLHLNGLTVRRSSLKKYHLQFIDNLRLHQDTEFINRLSYYIKMFPSNITEAVACRGVHNENRITNTGFSYKLYDNRYQLYTAVWSWSEQEGLAPYQKDFFLFQRIRFDLLREKSTLKRIIKYAGYGFRLKTKFFNHQLSSLIHSALFTTKWLRKPFLNMMKMFQQQKEIAPSIGLR